MPFYGDKTIEAIWQSAKPVEGYNPNIWRKDFAGAWIRRDFYGLRHKYGWKIDQKSQNLLVAVTQKRIYGPYTGKIICLKEMNTHNSKQVSRLTETVM